MTINGHFVRRLGIVTLAVVTLSTIPGCATFARARVSRAPEPIAAEPAPRPRSADLSAPSGMVFGSRMQEATPSESRLLANMTRQTFAGVGRDFDPDISPDSTTLIFASTRNAERSDIYYKRVGSHTVTQLTSDPADDVQPRFSPDGQRVVFCSNRSGNWDLWMINLDGTGLVQLTDHRSDEIAPCFSPDGRRVAFSVWGQRSHRWELWLLDVDAPGVRDFIAYGMFADFSPDGTRIAFQRARQRGTRWFSIWTIDLVDGEARHPTEVAFSDTAANTVPRFSPDGTRLVYSAVRQTDRRTMRDQRQRATADVWVVNVQTGVRSRVLSAGAAAFNPIWSRDGRIYFVASQTGTENIWSVASPDGGASQPAAFSADRAAPPADDPAVMANQPSVVVANQPAGMGAAAVVGPAPSGNTAGGQTADELVVGP